MRLFVVILLICSVLILEPKVSDALVRININQGTLEPMPIAIEDFLANNIEEEQIAKNLVSVIKNDLENSSLFSPIDRSLFLERGMLNKQPIFNNWRKIRANALVVGAVEMADDNKLVVQFKIWEPYRETMLGGLIYRVDKNGWRRVAHKIADKVYNAMTGESGYFDSRVVFVAESMKFGKPERSIAMMDQDGANLKILTSGTDFILQPVFDPQGKRVIYMSYRHKKEPPKVYIVNVETGWQELVGNFKGISFAPRFSPDGNHAIMSVGSDNDINIWEIDLRTKTKSKLTNIRGVVNTSPSYSPDGQRIVFNSNRSGSRQLYIMNRDGSDVKQISRYSGAYASPVWSPNGKYIAFTKIYAGTFYIGVMLPDGSGERLLVSSWLCESPTWSPSSSVVMFTKQVRGAKYENKIYTVDITGYHERMIPTDMSASEPFWSTLLP